MYKKIILASLTLALIVGGAISSVKATGSNQEPTSGSTVVDVDSCVQYTDGIMVGKFGKDPYFLANGVRDAGHGVRNYALFCLNDTQYKVDWTEVKLSQVPQPEPQPEVEAPVQAMFNFAHAYGSTAEGEIEYPLVLATDSYLDENTYFSMGVPAYIQSNIEELRFEVTPMDTTEEDLSYGFIWMSKDVALADKFSMQVAQNLAKKVDMSSKNTADLHATDFYKGKYVLVYVFVANNDGISAVANMPIEVDDILPIYVQFVDKPQIVPVPKPELPKIIPIPTPEEPFQSCGNSVGADGLYSVCVGDSIEHTTPLKVSLVAYTDEYITLKLRGADVDVIHVEKGNSKVVHTNSGELVLIEYVETSAQYGAFIQLTTVGLM